MTRDTSTNQPPRLGGSELYSINLITERIIGCAIEVHRALGPGLLESLYDAAMCIELGERGLSYVRQTRVPAYYKGRLLGKRVGLLINFNTRLIKDGVRRVIL